MLCVLRCERRKHGTASGVDVAHQDYKNTNWFLNTRVAASTAHTVTL
jgi:hypothetical protein